MVKVISAPADMDENIHTASGTITLRNTLEIRKRAHGINLRQNQDFDGKKNVKN